MTQRSVSVIAHRGASSYAPENTFPAFDLAIEMGADALETDVRASKDGILVLLHDALLDRTMSGHGPVSESIWPALQTLDAGGWFDQRFADARLPSLAEFLARYAGHAYLVLEIKAPQIEAQVIEALNRIPDDQVAVTSFAFESVEICKCLRPSLKAGWLTRQFGAGQIERVLAIGAEQICPPAGLVSPELVAIAHARGLEVRAWGVSDEASMARVVESGADGMTVNFPDKLVAYLRERGLRQTALG
jgi:glycerophosphoryl diester phosphodiesterase